MTNTYTLITGGTSGIGYEAAKTLLSEGKQVIITGQNATRVADAAASLQCKGIVADSADITSLHQLANQLSEENVKLDGLVLNAGAFSPEPFELISEATYDLTMAINTKGPLFTLKALLPLLQNPSSVVFVSTIAIDKGFQTSAVYAASKAAAEAYIRVANIELAPKGIRINTIRPGITETAIQAKAGMQPNDMAALFSTMDTMPLGRVLNPTDHAGVIAFLLSEASIAMRNAVIDVDGGYTL